MLASARAWSGRARSSTGAARSRVAPTIPTRRLRSASAFRLVDLPSQPRTSPWGTSTDPVRQTCDGCSDRAGTSDRAGGSRFTVAEVDCEDSGMGRGIRLNRGTTCGLAIPVQAESGNANASDQSQECFPCDGASLSGGLVAFSVWLSGCWRAGRGHRPRRSIPACRGCPAARDRRWVGPRRGGLGTGQAPGAEVSAFGQLAGTAGVLGRPARAVSTPKGIPTSITTPGGGQGPTALQMPISSPQPAAGLADFDPVLRDAGHPLPGGRRAARRPDARAGHRHHARAQPRPPPEVPRNPDGASGHSPGQPAGQPDLLPGRPAPPVQGRASSTGEARRPEQFDTNITYPLDISQKRQARTVVATRAEKVLEALYQDAVRQRIDDVYGAFVDGPGRSSDGALCGEERRADWRTSRRRPERLSRAER